MTEQLNGSLNGDGLEGKQRARYNLQTISGIRFKPCQLHHKCLEV